MFYNSTQDGIDMLDQKCSIYSTSRRTQRWPMAIFYRMLDISAANAYIINKMNQAQPKISRLVFMKQLAEDLIKPHLERRVHTFGLQRDLQFSIRRILKIEQTPSTSSSDNPEKFEKKEDLFNMQP